MERTRGGGLRWGKFAKNFNAGSRFGAGRCRWTGRFHGLDGEKKKAKGTTRAAGRSARLRGREGSLGEKSFERKGKERGGTAAGGESFGEKGVGGDVWRSITGKNAGSQKGGGKKRRADSKKESSTSTVCKRRRKH